MIKSGVKNTQDQQSQKISPEDHDGFFDEVQKPIDPIFQAAVDNISQVDLAHHKSQDQDRALPRTKPKKNLGREDVTIDLHGKNLDSSFAMIDRIFNTPQQKREINYKIITGRGIHSHASGVLVHEVYQYVLQRYSLRISEISVDPSSLKIGGMPMKGYFTVRLKRC
jgi:DNA-nicking Smr family endonuclease